MAKKTTTNKADFKSLRFAGLCLCFVGKSGRYGYERKDFENWARDDGAKVVKDVTEKTDILFALDKGATAGAKKKAQSLNGKGGSIVVLSESDFTEFFKPTEDEIINLLKSGKPGKTRLNQLMTRSFSYSFGHNLTFDLSDAKLKGLDVSDVRMQSFVFDGADLREAIVDTAEFGILRNVRLDNAKGDHFCVKELHDCICKNAQLANMFVGWNSHNSSVIACDFTGANLDEAYFGYSTLERTIFKRANLSEINCYRAILSDVEFSSANLSKANFEKARCTRTVFAKAKLTNANFGSADLSGCDFRGADLTGARLMGTNLTGANVSGAKFHGAIVVDTCFDGVDVSKAKGLTLHPISPATVGKACRELAKIAKQADEINIFALIKLRDQTVRINVTADNQHKPIYFAKYSFTHDGQTIHGSTETNTFTGAFEKLGQLWGHGELQLGTIDISTAKSPLKGKALKDLAAEALGEVFKTEALADEQLKDHRKQVRQQKSKQKQEMFAELRGGKTGIAKFNKRDIAVINKDKLILFRKEDLSNVKLDGLKQKHVDFCNSNFQHATFRRVHLDSCNLTNCDFSHADLSTAKLTFCDLSGSNVSEAKLDKCNLSHSILDRIDFATADLTGANMTGAILRGTRLADSKWKDAKWKGCGFDESTVFPDGFKIPDDFEYFGKGHDPRIVSDLPSLERITDFDDFMERLHATVDQSRLKKSLKMLKADRFQLFSEVTDDFFLGVVKSQTDSKLVYSCQLTSTGTFACCTQNLNPCGGLRGALCKHLLVLIVGLTKGGHLDVNSAATWAHASLLQKPELDHDVMSEVLLKYKGAEAGEVDWRPMETIPEDYYAL